MTTTPPRCLVVLVGVPWARRRAGWTVRHLAILAGLGLAGPVDCWCLVPDDGGTTPTPPGLDAAPIDGSAVSVPFRTRPGTRWARLRWQARGPRDTPFHLSLIGFPSPGDARELARRAAAYSSVWLLDKDPVELLAAELRAVGARTVMDMGDVEDVNVERVLTVARAATPVDRRRVAFLERTLDAWRRWNRRVLDTVDLTTVCKEEDRAHLDHDRVAVLPNGCDVPDDLPATPRRPGPPRVLFQGVLTYGPNYDAAKQLVRDIAPQLAEDLGEPIEVRLVGESDPVVESLAATDASVTVTVTGFVDDIVAELRDADLVVVPLRLGGGTKLKVLEAWAHRLPVVASAMACEGLDAQPDEHVLLADTPAEFAAAAARVLREPGLREHLTARAHRHAVEHFDWRAIERRVAELRRSIESGEVLRSLEESRTDRPWSREGDSNP